jgi:G3E family GTPase
MSASTAVYLITGFLGSGKTTFLNRIVRGFPATHKLMILMNEFGDIGLDGALVEKNGLSMLEISKGSIFCVCVKTDFIKGLVNIAQNVQPDVLVIEATGVANPSDLKRDLKLSIFQNRFQFKEQFCLIDTVNFEDAYDTFTSVEKQIESATLFIINKIDEAEAGTIARVKQIVARHHPDPVFFESVYADIPLKKFIPQIVPSQKQSPKIPISISENELDRVIDSLLTEPDSSMTPPDRLMSATFVWSGENRQQFDKLTTQIPPRIVRAKGFIRAGSEIYLFNWVMGQSKIEKVVKPKPMATLLNKVVFIGPPEAFEDLDRINLKYLHRQP